MNTVAAENSRTIDRRHLITAGIIVVWFSLVISLGLSNAYITLPNQAPITLIASFFIIYLVFTIAYLGFPAIKEYLLGLDMRFLIMLNSWRMIGIGFIMLNMFGHLPTLFAYLAGVGDALTAMAAVFLAFNMMKRKEGISKRAILRWNTFGLIDFILAVSIGLLTRTDALLMQSNGINSDMMIAFPMVIIPGFLVQLLSLTHIIIYLQLRNNHRNDTFVKIK